MAAPPLTALVSLAIVALAAMPVAAQPGVEPVAKDLAFPTNMAFAPDGRIFFTEKQTATTDSVLRLAGTPTASPVPVGSPTSPGSGRGSTTGVGLVIAAVLIGGLILLRRRMIRR